MDKNIIIGAMTALITPFKNGKLDEQSYARLIQRQIDNGIDAVVPVGTTGESATLTHEEHRTCIEIAVSAVSNTYGSYLARGDLKPLLEYESNIAHLCEQDLVK
ncbi:dihydrodipicolinate synthase family protein, partial [Campylobacter coli]|uniref:dihydrodipicolinate synthase family protein n=1 Tax=Campylobacter coli TaxID=195 RepID=UPI00275D6D1F